MKSYCMIDIGILCAEFIHFFTCYYLHLRHHIHLTVLYNFPRVLKMKGSDVMSFVVVETLLSMHAGVTYLIALASKMHPFKKQLLGFCCAFPLLKTW